MRNVIIILGFMMAMQLMAQDRSVVTVKGSELNSGVVLLTMTQTASAAKGPASFVLQCTKDMPDCKAPKPGTYTMVRLPKNYGMYDCVNVDLYAGSTSEENGEKIGEYCLIEK